MTPHLLACTMALLFSTSIFQQAPSAQAGEDESGSSILSVEQPSMAGSRNDLSEDELDRAYAQTVSETDEKKRKKREAEEHKTLEEEFDAFLAEEKRKEREAAADKEAQKKLEEHRSDPAQWRLIVYSVQMMLGRFGYGTGPFDGKLDEKNRRALKEFQTYNGLSATGDIDWQTLQKLSKDQEALDQLPVHLGGHSFSELFWDEFVVATGTWTFKDSLLGNPLQATRIECHRQWMRCIEATVDLHPPDFYLAAPHLEYHKIDRWDAHEIITSPNDKVCVRYTLRISRSQQTVTGLRSPIKSKGDCGFVEPRDFQLQLSDGTKIWLELNKRRGEAISRILRMDRFLLKNIEGF